MVVLGGPSPHCPYVIFSPVGASFIITDKVVRLSSSHPSLTRCFPREVCAVVLLYRSDVDGALGQSSGPTRFQSYQSFGDDNFEPGNQLHPINIGYGLKVETIATGGQHVCVRALRSRRSPADRTVVVKCWG